MLAWIGIQSDHRTPKISGSRPLIHQLERRIPGVRCIAWFAAGVSMFDSYDWPRIQGLVSAAVDALRAIEQRNKEEARLAKIRADKEAEKE